MTDKKMGQGSGSVPPLYNRARTLPAILGGKPIRKRVLPYSRQTIFPSDLKAVRKVMRSDFLTTGPMGNRFGQAIAARTGFDSALPLSSGTAALITLLMSLENVRGHEVITSPMTFAATTGAILMAGGVPVMADVDPVTLNVDPRRVAELINEKTAAVLAVDYAGHPAHWQELRRLCDNHRIPLLVDCAHSLGSSIHGHPVGYWAHAAVFSFHPVKAVACGEGGAIASSDRDILRRATLIANHWMVKFEDENPFTARPWYYEIQGQGFNYRLNDISSALGLSQIKRLNTRIDACREVSIALRKRLSSIAFLDMPCELDGYRHSYHLFVARVRQLEEGFGRNLLVAALRAENITAHVHYIPIHLHPHFRDKILTGDLKNCDQAYNEIMTLPCFDSMTEKDVRDIGLAIEKIATHSSEILSAMATEKTR